MRRWFLRLGWSFPALLLSSPGQGRPVPVLTQDFPGDPGCTLVLRPLLRLNQKPPAGNWWSDGLSHNPQLAWRQVRRLPWKPIKTEADTFSLGLMSRWVSQLSCCPHIHAGEPRPGLAFLIFPKVDRLVPSAETQSEGNCGNQGRGHLFLDTLPVPVGQRGEKEHTVRCKWCLRKEHWRSKG